MKRPKGLTDKQWAFVCEYPKDWNATQAAKRAGYNGDNKTLAQIGWDNLRKLEIKSALKSVYETLAMSSEEMFSRLNHIAADENEDTPDRLRALSMIGKGHAVFVDKVENDTTLNINVNFGDSDE